MCLHSDTSPRVTHTLAWRGSCSTPCMQIKCNNYLLHSTSTSSLPLYIHQASRPGENKLFLALRYGQAVAIHQDVKFRQCDLFQILCASKTPLKRACKEPQRERLSAATQPMQHRRGPNARGKMRHLLTFPCLSKHCFERGIDVIKKRLPNPSRANSRTVEDPVISFWHE